MLSPGQLKQLTRRSILASCGAASIAAAALDGLGQEVSRRAHILEELTLVAGDLLLAFHTGPTGLSLARIANRSRGAEHLTASSPVFKLSTHAEDASCESNRGVQLESADFIGPGRTIQVTGIATAFPLAFTLTVEPLTGESAALVRLSVTNHGTTRLSFQTTAPYIQGIRIQAQQRPMMAALPQEAGGVISFGDPAKKLGMSFNRSIGLPTAMNTMELASLYDPDGHGGVFFADAEADLDIGIAPAQLTFSGIGVSGHAVLELDPNETKHLPAFTIGVHNTGDWHAAVDHYVKHHRAHWRFPEVPAWFRDEGAIYSFSGSGGGAIYMEYPQQDLASRIPSFDQLHLLLGEAQKLGTNILYLWDYWEGTSEGGRPPYWNKGDYIPRADLGGPEAFKNGIREVHKRGGRVILYVEPFIVFWYSQLGKDKGKAWAGRDADGALYHQYPQNYSMISSLKPWQKFLVDKSRMLVEEYGADGIYLDSWGWQLNWRMQATSDRGLSTSLDYSLGVLDLAKQVRQAIRSVRPDAIVMGESTSGALSRYWDGGLSADFAWLAAQNQHRIVGSPVRYGIPEVNIFSNGRNLNELNQVFAAGHGLALLNANLHDAEYIRKLVQIRQKYKDALIHGKQIGQPTTGSDSVPAYYYQGSVQRLITVVNTVAHAYSGDLVLDGIFEPQSQWLNLLTGETMTASNGKLRASLAGESLLVLARQEPSKSAA